MKIKTRGHGGETAVLQIALLFAAKDDDCVIESGLEGEKAYARVSFDGKVGTGEARAFTSDRLAVNNAIKKSVYLAFKKISEMPTPWGISTGIRPAKIAGALALEEGEERALQILTDEYLMDESKARLALAVSKRERSAISSMPKNAVGIYVGIPFCPSRCAYCSFISEAVAYNEKYIEPYVDALIEEIKYSSKIVSELGQRPDTVYFGGGTPTAIETPFLEKIIVALGESFDLSAVREFTVEAGRPDTINYENMAMLRRLGVGRVSVNPQTMHQETLDRVGRRHSVDDVKRAFCAAREAGIESINADLIAGLPGEDEQKMIETVDSLLALSPDAVTLHTLYLKRASALIGDFHRLRFAKNTAKMVDAAAKRLGDAGMNPYYMYKQRNTLGNLENTAYARDGHESLYNIYIMEETLPILALGAGASTKMVGSGNIERVFNPKNAADYIKRLPEVLQRKDAYGKYFQGGAICRK